MVAGEVVRGGRARRLGVPGLDGILPFVGDLKQHVSGMMDEGRGGMRTAAEGKNVLDPEFSAFLRREGISQGRAYDTAKSSRRTANA